MSKKRRRNSRKRKGSCSSKHSHSSFNFQLLNRSQNNSPVPENDTTEKGETDSLRKEFFVLESDEGDETEPEIPFKEKGFRRDSYEDTYQKKERNILQEKDTDEEVKIVTSVTIGNHEVSSSRTVFQQSREPVHQDQTNSPMSTTKVKCTGSNMKLEINEVLHSQKSDIQTTLVVQNKGGKRKEACFKKDLENHSTPNNDKLTRRYSVNHSYTTRNYKNTCEQKNYEFTVTEMGRDFKDAVINKIYYKCNEDKDCCKNCCKCRLDNQNSCHHSDFYPMTLLSSIPNSLSDLCPLEVKPSSFNMTSTEVFPEVPPPHEFADRDPDLVEDLRHGIGSFQIRSCDKYASLAESEDSRYNLSSCCQNSLEGEHCADGVGCFENSSESGDYETLFMEPKAAMSRSSFTEDFIHNHKGKTWLRNNSIAILESKPRTSNYLDKQPTRRKTFPGLADTSKRIEESLSRESFSSGTLSSFYMQSFPLQKERSAKYYTEDERPFISRGGSCNSSGCSSNYKPSSRNGAGHNTCLSNLCTNDKNEEVSLNYRQCIQQQHISDQETVTPSTSFQGNAYTEPSDNDSFVVGAVDHSEVAESGFDEEMAENEEHSPEASAEGLLQKDLEIHVTPPSRSTSQDLISEDVPVIPNVDLQEVASTVPVPKKRRGSVMTIIIGDSEQRYLQNDAKPLEVTFAERHHRDMFSAFYDGSSMSPIMDVGEMEADSNSNDVKRTPKRSLSPEPDISIQNFLPINDVQDLPEQRAEIQASAPIESGSHLTDDATLEEKDHSKAEDRQIVALPDTSFPTPGPQDNLTGDVKPKLQQTDSTEKQTLSTSSINIKLELKEHLKPPDPVLKEPEDVPDHWAKRRMLFKESKERSSAGGSSLTSNITEESGNSEDARSMDMTMRDFEDKGFYTETFHSASWIYRGDDVNPNNSPRCLSSRPRPVTLRERTVKISKGMGDYPWGFRIQFSKPIVVTEVDTNGAAEEAGLLVGDYVMSVNGTDVTSIPHSEAADLARQGPDLLTLTIGSDISRCPNTPRPSCRGYLHKRTQSGFLKGWRKRWFVLKHDCCLYYYRHKRDEGKSKALATLKLEGADVGPDTSLGKPFVFRCSPLSRSRVYYFCATSNQEMKRWVEAMNRAVHPITQNHVWVDVTQHNSNLPPLAIKDPECLGLLHQIDKSKDLWVQHYCALKDGCLYFYAGIRSTRALGGIYLHGYTVKEQNLGSKRSAIELKPPSEEFKTFHLCAENATENKRWILAMKSSISKWLPLHQAIQELMNRPPEETRM